MMSLLHQEVQEVKKKAAQIQQKHYRNKDHYEGWYHVQKQTTIQKHYRNKNHCVGWYQISYQLQYIRLDTTMMKMTQVYQWILIVHILVQHQPRVDLIYISYMK